MLHNLPAPLAFLGEVLAMLEANSYDTVCHEHVEYYGPSQIQWMADKAGGKIVDVEFNDVNGSSFSVTTAR